MPNPTLSQSAQEVHDELRMLATGRTEWRVQDPASKSYCMYFSRDTDIDPERAAREWLADFKTQFPHHAHAGYEVAEVRVFTELERAALDAADQLDALSMRLKEALATNAGHEGSASVGSAHTAGPLDEAVRKATPEHEAAIDEALGLKAISIRLPVDLIDRYKALAAERGLLYQPLMRQALAEFAAGGTDGVGLPRGTYSHGELGELAALPDAAIAAAFRDVAPVVCACGSIPANGEAHHHGCPHGVGGEAK